MPKLRVNNINNLKKPVVILLLMLLAFLNTSAFAKSADEIVVTTNILSSMVSQVAGENHQVTTLMRVGIDPHLYRATHGDIGRLSKAKIIFFNGLLLEGKMAAILAKMNQGDRRTVAVGDLIPKNLLRPAQDESTIYDPHIWFDPLIWVKTIPIIRDELTKLYPTEAKGFKERADKLQQELNDLHKWAEQELIKIPKSKRVLITAHDAFGYFGSRYDIEVVGLQGISTTSEFGLGDLKRVMDIIIDRQIPAVFVESSVPKRFIESLIEGVTAKGGTVKLGGELYSDSLGSHDSGADTFQSMFRHNVTTVTNALK